MKINLLLIETGEQASVGCSSADRDALTAEDCVNIGYIAFKRDNYHSMLHWLQLAKKKRDSDLEGNEGSFNDEELTKYLSVAHVMVSLCSTLNTSTTVSIFFITTFKHVPYYEGVMNGGSYQASCSSASVPPNDNCKHFFHYNI